MATRERPSRWSLWPARLCLVTAALASSVWLSGCVEFLTVVGADGRIRREVRCEVDQIHAEAARSELRRVFSRGAGWYIKEYERGDRAQFIARCRSVEPKDDPFGQTLKVTRARQGLKAHYTYEEHLTDATLFRSDAERQCADHLVLTYRIRMPGRVLSFTPPEGEADGGAVTWAIPLSRLKDGVTITIEAERFDRKWTAGALLIIAVGLTLLWWVFVRMLVWHRVRAERLAALREKATPTVEVEDGLGGPQGIPEAGPADEEAPPGHVQ